MSTAGPKYPFEQNFTQPTDDLLKYREVYGLFKGDESDVAKGKQKGRELQAAGLIQRFIEYKKAADAYLADLDTQLAESNTKMQEAQRGMEQCDVDLDALKQEKKMIIHQATREISTDLKGQTTRTNDNGYTPSKKKSNTCTLL